MDYRLAIKDLEEGIWHLGHLDFIGALDTEQDYLDSYALLQAKVKKAVQEASWLWQATYEQELANEENSVSPSE